METKFNNFTKSTTSLNEYQKGLNEYQKGLNEYQKGLNEYAELHPSDVQLDTELEACIDAFKECAKEYGDKVMLSLANGSPNKFIANLTEEKHITTSKQLLDALSVRITGHVQPLIIDFIEHYFPERIAVLGESVKPTHEGTLNEISTGLKEYPNDKSKQKRFDAAIKKVEKLDKAHTPGDPNYSLNRGDIEDIIKTAIG